MALKNTRTKQHTDSDDIQELRDRLEEAELTLEAIRSGKVDALVGKNNQIFTLKSADFSYRILVESMNQGAVTFSADGTIVYCNNFLSQMVKMPLEHLIGSDIKKYVIAEEQQKFKDLLEKNDDHRTYEFQFLATDGSKIPVYVAVKPLDLGIDHKVTGMIVTDLTETKNNEQIAAAEKLAIQQLVHEHESEKRAKELEYVMKQRRDLLASNQAKDEFISIASHQLRTPATSVKQYLGMIIEGFGGEVPEKLQFFLKTAYASNERQLSIIDELLKIAQIDSGSFKLKKDKVNITKLVKDVLEQFQPTLKLRRQKIIFTSVGHTVTRVDAHEMSLAVSNLVENASKYSPVGKDIKVIIQRTAKRIIIKVQDNGVGIAEANIKKIFDKFTRIDNSLSDTVTGTGLGLYWVKRIVKLHKGTLTVESVLHKGSTFIVSIPA